MSLFCFDTYNYDTYMTPIDTYNIKMLVISELYRLLVSLLVSYRCQVISVNAYLCI